MLNSVGATSRVRMTPEDRRRQLVGIGLRKFVERPVQELSLDEVAAEAGVSRGLLFHYFPTKTDYHRAVVEAARRRVGAQRLPRRRRGRRGRRAPGRRTLPRPGGPAARVVRRARARPGPDRARGRRRPGRDRARARGRGGGAAPPTCRMPRCRPCTAGSPTSRTARCSGPRCRRPSGMPAGSPWSTTAPARSPSSPPPPEPELQGRTGLGCAERPLWQPFPHSPRASGPSVDVALQTPRSRARRAVGHWRVERRSRHVRQPSRTARPTAGPTRASCERAPSSASRPSGG